MNSQPETAKMYQKKNLLNKSIELIITLTTIDKHLALGSVVKDGRWN